MKPRYAPTLILLLLCTCLLVACSTEPSLIGKGEDGYTLTLPVSGEIIEVRKTYESYLSSIDSGLVREAEEALAPRIEENPENSGYYLSVDQEGYLCLCVEVIRSITPPADADSELDGGCGVDHEHLMYCERISKKPGVVS